MNTTSASPVSEAIQQQGFLLCRELLPQGHLSAIRHAIVRAATAIDPTIDVRADDVDAAWAALTRQDRSRGGLLYNAVKRIPEVHALASSEVLMNRLRELGVQQPAIVDVNFRVDAPNEPQYLFAWHQDYWFSICSPKALVVWLPITDLDDQVGGVELLPLARTEHRVLRAKRGPDYTSYSNSLVLDEAVDTDHAIAPKLAAGDALVFRFDVLHRSRPNGSSGRCRWTLQIRVADFADPVFLDEGFKPGIVTADRITYLDRIST